MHIFLFYDIFFFNSPCVMNVTYFYVLFLQKVNIYFLKNFLIDARLVDLLNYDVTKHN